MGEHSVKVRSTKSFRKEFGFLEVNYGLIIRKQLARRPYLERQGFALGWEKILVDERRQSEARQKATHCREKEWSCRHRKWLPSAWGSCRREASESLLVSFEDLATVTVV